MCKNEYALPNVLLPMVFVAIDAFLRWTFDHYAWELKIGWILFEFVLLIGAGWFVISSDRAALHKIAKLLWLVVIYVMIRMPMLDVKFLLEMEGAFVCFQMAEFVLLDRNPVTDDNRIALTDYWKDWFILVVVIIAWLAREIVLFFMGRQDPMSVYVAGGVAIFVLLLAMAFNLLGNDFWNKVLQGLIFVGCLWLLFTAHANDALWYWGMLNLALKLTEIVSKFDFKKVQKLILG